MFVTASPSSEIYALSLHDALPICRNACSRGLRNRLDKTSGAAKSPGIHAVPHSAQGTRRRFPSRQPPSLEDRKSTRLNSSHVEISYAVFCLKKKTSAGGVRYLAHR